LEKEEEQEEDELYKHELESNDSMYEIMNQNKKEKVEEKVIVEEVILTENLFSKDKQSKDK